MAERKTGLSHNFIIHPGETLREVLEERNISQAELAYRAGVTGAYISNVINGKKSISTSLAKKLEYALGIKASLWNNLQKNYDEELQEFEELNGVSDEEKSIVKQLNEPIRFMQKHGLLKRVSDCDLVLEMRRFFEIADLALIPSVTYGGRYRISMRNKVNPYINCLWIRLCEKLTENLDVKQELDIAKLKSSIPQIKEIMGEHPNDIRNKLTEILAACGIAFSIVPHFRGAPVQGYIKKRGDGALMLVLTLRGARADVFWFTLFHEIGHIVEMETNGIRGYNEQDEAEEAKADNFAANTLLDQQKYGHFVRLRDFSLSSIEEFALTQHVPSYIVIGRLKKEKHIPQYDYTSQMIQYKWAGETGL